jgi:outer membrane immunogenic protein
MQVPVTKACTFVLMACVGACLTEAAGALELNNLPATSSPPQKPDWAGFYLQNNSGAGSAGLPWTTSTPSAGFSSPGETKPPINESFGYNFQSGNFVFGLEGSLAAANFDGRFTSPYIPAAGAWSPNMNWLGTVTGRVGYSFGQWLPYVKGGFVAADVGSPLQGAPVGAFSQGSTLGGWTGGVGVEYQFTPKLSLGLEYLYTDFGSGAASGTPPMSGSPEMYSTALKSQSLLGRLNYKTGW